MPKILCYIEIMKIKIDKVKLEQCMASSGVNSFSALAIASGLHRNTIYPYVRGELSPFTEAYLSICKALDTAPMSLLSEETSDDLKEIIETLKKVTNRSTRNNCKIGAFLYGSRVTGKARKYSDYDIGLTGGEVPLFWQDFLDIKEQCDSSFDNLPVKISILNFDEAPSSFFDDFDSPVKYLCGDYASFSFFKGSLYGRAKKKKAA
jgi:hypothetical protein